ncbi:MAG: Thimet oligopeptidase [Ramlibacter sp.]|nr:Thimet oligopeptidase [Ramlibacter sp.]
MRRSSQAAGLILALSLAPFPGVAQAQGLAAPAANLPLGGSAALLAGEPQSLLAACRAAMAAARAGMAALPASEGQALAAFDTNQKILSDAGARAGLASQVHPDPALREAAERCDREVSAVRTDFALDRRIYDSLRAVNAAPLDAATRHYLERTLRSFRLAGVDRDDAVRSRIKQLHQDLTRLSQAFNNNIRDSVLTLEVAPADLAGLPADFVKAHAPDANGRVALSTDNPDYTPVMAYARKAEVREAFWKLYRQRAHPANLAALDQMLARRHELARLLGFANWADYVTADKMIGTGAKAGEFIERIAAAAAPRAERDYADLLARKRRDDPTAAQVLPWDTGYYYDRIRAERFGVDAQQVRPYFQYASVKRAVLETTARLFNIRYEPVRGAAVWHADVEVYDVFDGERKLGRIYLDMHPRASKYKHYAHFRLVSGKAGVTLPESVLVCNFRQPTASDPGLLEYRDVTTFFHEFGHLLHAILGGQSRWAGLSGVSTERDFVEAPSQMLEEWVRDPKTLQGFALHYQTGQPLPAELATRLLRAEELGKGMFVRQQMAYAAISLGLHDRDPAGLDTTEFSNRMQERYTPFRSVPGTYFHEAFGHLDGYSAVYYTYMWSLVIAKDMFSAFRAQGDIMDPAMADRYRRAVLEPGSSKPAAELVRDFLGRPYGFASYEAWLNSD